MYQQLYQYFILYRQLSLPGVGTFVLEKSSARGNFAEKTIHPPAFSVSYRQEAITPPVKFFNWLSAALGISRPEAVIRFNDFVFELRQKIDLGDVVAWNGIGTIQKGLGGENRFTPALMQKEFEPSLPAEKVIREKAEHMVRVGEDERTAAEMTEILNQPVKKRSGWWIIALILLVLSVGFTGWYFSQYGFDPGAAANRKITVPVEGGSTYREIR